MIRLGANGCVNVKERLAKSKESSYACTCRYQFDSLTIQRVIYLSHQMRYPHFSCTSLGIAHTCIHPSKSRRCNPNSAALNYPSRAQHIQTRIHVHTQISTHNPMLWIREALKPYPITVVTSHQGIHPSVGCPNYWFCCLHIFVFLLVYVRL